MGEQTWGTAQALTRTMTTEIGVAPIDGRHARRGRNNDAVIDAVLDFFRDGEPFPTAQQVADRAGVSLRSIYRYHPDLDALIYAAFERAVDRNRRLLEFVPPPSSAPLVERLAYLVRQRLDLFRHLTPQLRAVLARAARDEAVRALLDVHRASFVQHLHDLFVPELAQLRPVERATIIGSVHTALLFEGYENLRLRHGMSDDEIADAYRLTVRNHFARFL